MYYRTQDTKTLTTTCKGIIIDVKYNLIFECLILYLQLIRTLINEVHHLRFLGNSYQRKLYLSVKNSRNFSNFLLVALYNTSSMNIRNPFNDWCCLFAFSFVFPRTPRIIVLKLKKVWELLQAFENVCLFYTVHLLKRLKIKVWLSCSIMEHCHFISRPPDYIE